jgi:hypothetical protein
MRRMSGLTDNNQSNGVKSGYQVTPERKPAAPSLDSQHQAARSVLTSIPAAQAYSDLGAKASTLGAIRPAARVFRSSAPRHARPRRRRSGTVIGLVVAVIVFEVVLALTRFSPMRWIVYAAWMVPITELAMLVCGQLAYRYWFREAAPGTFTKLIIQITTTGREFAKVSEIIADIRACNVKADYQVWVVTEPGQPCDYPLADRVLVVPESFSVRSWSKARALEYSRRVRDAEGLARPDVKIIFSDDDVTLTEAYINRAFAADYDVCEGVVVPRTGYGAGPAGHFLASHADDVRTHACLVYCSVFQGILGRPIHVHGEGLVVTGAAERIVTWDWPVLASEDLVFGQRAASAGLTWGWFHEYAEITSPWSVREFLIQRRRWLWGDIHAITRRDVLPLGPATLILGKYVVGVVALVASAAGLYMRVTGRIPPTAGALDYAKLSVLAWAGVFFACGWVGAATAGQTSDARLLAGVAAVMMLPVSLILSFAAIVIPLGQGSPRTFAVITKTRR